MICRERVQHIIMRLEEASRRKSPRERVTSVLLNEGGRNFWAEIKRIRGMINMY